MNKRQHNLNHRDYDSVQELFEEVVRLDDDIENTSEWIRQKKREYLMENGLDESSADDLIRELEDEMREIEDEIRQKERKLEELKERKEKVRELAGSVELEQEGSDGGDESDEVKELRAKGYGIKKKGGGSD
jgi:predicted  nucleic acid-binding Zn-ribbon protein